MTSAELPADERRNLRRWCYALVLTVQAALLFATMCRTEPLQSANDRSRWCTVWSLVHRGTYAIDEIVERPGWDTIDKVRFHDHFYSSKPALLPTLAAGAYWLIWHTTGWNLDQQPKLAANAVLFFFNFLPLLGAVALIAIMVERAARHDFTRLLVVTTAAFGTYLLPFSITFNNHTVAAIAVLIAVYSALRFQDDDSPRPAWFAVCGFFAAFAATSELPAALFGLAMFGLSLGASVRRTFAAFVPAAVIPLAAFFVCTYAEAGSWKPFYLAYGTEVYEYVYEGRPSYWMNPRGIDANNEPFWLYALHCTIGHHGILSLSPIFLLAVAGWRETRSVESPGMRRLSWIGLALTIAILAFYLTRTSNYNYGGNTAGLRWMFWLIPFWLLAMIPVCDRFAGLGWFRGLSLALLAVSMFSAFDAFHNPWQPSWLYRRMNNWEWINYNSPAPPPFAPPASSWIRRLPADSQNDQRPWIEFRGIASEGRYLHLRLEDGGSTTTIEGRTLRILNVERWQSTVVPKADNEQAVPRETTRYWIDPLAFAAGEPPRQFLHWPEGTPTSAQRLAAAHFFQNLPLPRSYNRGRVAYVRTPLRHDYFRCDAAASQVTVAPPTPALRYRSDVWYADDVPFGTIQLETTVSNAETGEVFLKQKLTAVAASRIGPENASNDRP